MSSHPVLSLVSDPFLLQHDTGGGDHPEIPERLQVVAAQLHKGELGHLIENHSALPIAREHLLSFHTEAWLFRFEEAVLSGKTYLDHPDNQVCYETYEVALLSAGTGLAAVDLVEQNGAKTVFCSTRPPGHHAEPNMPFGFCFLNNCVIAARYWQKQYDRPKVCVLDFDAHHGNGIQTAFEEDSESLYISIHEHPSFSYPGTGYAEETGIGKGFGTVLNIPLPPGAGDRRATAAFDGLINHKLEEFRPDVLIVAAGFDGHSLDDMSGLNYSTSLYKTIGERIRFWADKYCQGRVISMLEGGYHLESLAQSVEAYLFGLMPGND